jgi:hypothetical protein
VTCTFVNVRTTYVRPKGASPLLVSLVPGYDQCAAPNRTHGPPLASASCEPPAPSSSHLTVGTPDVNGAPANAVSSLRVAVVGTAGGPDDSDVTIQASMRDVRCLPATLSCGLANSDGGADYVGHLRPVLTLRITDLSPATQPGTVQDAPFELVVPCAASASTAQGATCSVATSADSVVPGAVQEFNRAIWEVGQVEVWDGGTDGDVSTSDGDGVYLREGVFIP